MKINKLMSVVISLPLLVSCANKGYAGTYVFQLGKSKDTHMGVSLKLTNDIYSEEEPELGNKFELDFDFFSDKIEADFAGFLAAINPITGFYTVDSEQTVYDLPRLHVGLQLIKDFDLPNDVIDLLFVANINKDVVNFYVPVSFKDLTLQLYWYGYDLNINALINEDETDDKEPLQTPEGKHEVGSHPTKEDIDKINEHYPDNHDGEKFRDYHLLKLGLTKK